MQGAAADRWNSIADCTVIGMYFVSCLEDARLISRVHTDSCWELEVKKSLFQVTILYLAVISK